MTYGGVKKENKSKRNEVDDRFGEDIYKDTNVMLLILHATECTPAHENGIEMNENENEFDMNNALPAFPSSLSERRHEKPGKVNEDNGFNQVSDIANIFTFFFL